MSQPTPNHYDVLGVARDATPEEIKAAFRKKSSEHHPDKGGDAAAMQAVNRAYEVLSDPARRSQYDESGDDEQRNLEADAQGLLASLFQSAMASQDETIDPVKWTFYQLQGKVTEAEAEVKAAHRYIEKLGRRRGTVRRKTADKPNLVHSLIDARIASIRKTIPQNERVAAVARAALEALKDYEYVEPEPPGFNASREQMLESGLRRLYGKRDPHPFDFFPRY